MKARILTGMAVLALSAAVPVSASAATTVVAGPLKVKGYNMTLIGADAKKDTLTVMFSKAKGKASQQHMYQFGTKVKVTKTSISAKLGRFGSVNLRLTNARNASGKSKLPKGCTGTVGKTKTGKFRGSLKFVADRTFFRTVKAKTLNGVVSSSGKLDCSGSGSGKAKGDGSGDGLGVGGPSLTLTKAEEDGTFMFRATPSDQMAIQTEMGKKAAPATSISHMITGVGPSLLIAGVGATVPSVAPFVTGKGTFTAAGPAVGTIVTGPLSGNLVAKFDSVPQVSVVGDNALLMNP